MPVLIGRPCQDWITTLVNVFTQRLWENYGLLGYQGYRVTQMIPLSNRLVSSLWHGSIHFFDLYCQILIQVLVAARSIVPLEDLYKFESTDELNSFQGRLLAFRSRIYSKGVKPPGLYRERPTSRIQVRAKAGGRIVRTSMALRNMYVFSDTSAMNLTNGPVCGIGIFGEATVDEEKPTEVQLNAIPLIVGLGGLGQSSNGWWDIR